MLFPIAVRNKVLPFALIALLAQNCGQPNEKSTIQKATTDSNSGQDTLEQAILKDLTAIHHNLALVRKTYGIIGKQSPEVSEQRTEILESISLINTLLADNETKISGLMKQKAGLLTKNKALAQLLEETTLQLQQQQKEILGLKQELALGEFKVTDLAIKMDEISVENEKLKEEKLALETLNAQYTQDQNRVFITYGTEKELLEKGIAEKRAINSVKRLGLTSTFTRNRSFFVGQDLRNVKEFPISGKTAHLLSLHPEDSYHISPSGKGYCKLEITNTEDFWSISKYLVIQVSN